MAYALWCEDGRRVRIRRALVSRMLASVTMGAGVAYLVFVFFSPDPSRELSVRHLPEWEHLPEAGTLISGDEALGKIMLFSDFECRHCREAFGALMALREEKPQAFAIVMFHLPAVGRRDAMEAAIASECAASQGRGEQYVGALFGMQESLGELSYEEVAHEVGVLDTLAFRECRASDAVAEWVLSQREIALRVGIYGTPSIAIRDQLVTGNPPAEVLERWVTELLPEDGRR